MALAWRGTRPLGCRGWKQFPPRGDLARSRQPNNAMLLCAGAQCAAEIRAAQPTITFQRRGDVRDCPAGPARLHCSLIPTPLPRTVAVSCMGQPTPHAPFPPHTSLPSPLMPLRVCVASTVTKGRTRPAAGAGPDGAAGGGGAGSRAAAFGRGCDTAARASARRAARARSAPIGERRFRPVGLGAVGGPAPPRRSLRAPLTSWARGGRGCRRWWAGRQRP